MARSGCGTPRGLAARVRGALARAEKAHYPFRNYRHAHAESAVLVGCNVVSLFPRTVDAAVRLLRAEAGAGAAFDCCGAPLALDGDPAAAQRVRAGVADRLRACGVREAVALCPTCAATLADAPGLRVVSVYAKLRELGLGTRLAADGAVFPPCPDRARGAWLADVFAFFDGEPAVLRRAPCCGLGTGGGPHDPDRARAMAQACLGQARAAAAGPLYVYCASCAGSFAGNGGADVRFVLSEVLGVHEEPQVGATLLNRARSALR